MEPIERGTLPEGKVPAVQVGLDQKSTYINYSSKTNVCKPFDQTFFNRYDREGIKAHMQAYLDLGLTPIPLKGKIPVVKWLHGNWHPKTLADLASYLNRSNWGIRTGGDFAVIDLDTKESYYQFIAENAEKLPINTPIVKTGRGYHIWFRPTQPLRDMHFQGIDIKGEGGQVVAPPSIHPKTHQRYWFIRPPKGDIPELDINELVFPELKKQDNLRASKPRGSRAITDNYTDRPRFDYDDIKDGVDDGGRTTAMVRYIGHLIWRGLSKDEILTLVIDWNTKNRPPMTEEKVEFTVNDCYQRYASKNSDTSQDDADKRLDTAANTPVSIKTLAKSNSVIVETKPYTRPSRIQPLYTPDSPTPISGEPVDPWALEEEPRYTVADCGKKRAIVRRGREYMSVSFFCGKWSCPRCGPYFRQRWIDHMVEKTKDTELYVTKISEDDWGCVRKQINRLNTDYMRIKVGEIFKVITDKPLEDSTKLAQEDIVAFLESSIPTTAIKCPISTSRNWEHHKKEKTSNEYEAVTITWLPVKDQVEVAKELGAEAVKRTRWLSPRDADEVEWAENFKESIRERERLVNWWLRHPMYGLDMREYLNQQYAADAINDECGEEDFIDRMLVEAS